MGAGPVRVEPLGGHRASAVPGDAGASGASGALPGACRGGRGRASGPQPGHGTVWALWGYGPAGPGLPWSALACPGRYRSVSAGPGRYRQAPVGLLFSRPEPVRAGPGLPRSAPVGPGRDPAL